MYSILNYIVYLLTYRVHTYSIFSYILRPHMEYTYLHIVSTHTVCLLTYTCPLIYNIFTYILCPHIQYIYFHIMATYTVYLSSYYVHTYSILIYILCPHVQYICFHIMSTHPEYLLTYRVHMDIVRILSFSLSSICIRPRPNVTFTTLLMSLTGRPSSPAAWYELISFFISLFSADMVLEMGTER